MHEIPILRDVVVIFGVAVLVLLVFHRLRLPPIVGFLMTGMIIGPSGLSLVSSVHEVELLAEIGIILLLFTIGIEFSLTSLLRSKKAVLLGGSVQVILTILLTVLVARMFDVEPARALFYGMLVALSSTAIVLRTLQERAEIDSPPGRTSLAILIFQDIIIVPMIILTPFLSGTSEAASEPVWMIVLKAVGVIVLVVALARFVVPAVLGQVTRTRSRELFLLSIALIAIAVAWLTSKAGLSLSLGAFLAGLIISESEYSLQALDGILPFKDVFTSFFFVSVGMIADLNYIISHPIIIIVGALIVFIAKASLASLASFFLGLSLRAALVAGLALAQVGEFSFILSKVGVHYDLMSKDVYQLFIAVSIFTMAATPFVIAVSPRWAEKLSSIGFLKRLRPTSFGELRKPSEQLNNHLIIIGFGLNGYNLSRAARMAGIPYTVLEMNPDTVKRERKKGEPIFYGDAASEEVLKQAGLMTARAMVVAISDPAATRRITYLAKHLNPALHLIVRTRFIIEVGALRELGADDVIPEEFETSIEIFTRVMNRFMVPVDQIERFISSVREDNYGMLRSLPRRTSEISDLGVRFSNLEICSIKIDDASPLANFSLADMNLRKKYGVTVLAIERGEEKISNPDGNQVMDVGDVIHILGDSDDLREFRIRLKEDFKPAEPE